MAIAKSNSLLKFGVPILAGILVFIGVYAFKGTKSGNENNAISPSDVIYNLTEEEQKELNLAAGDTPHDTLKTLLGVVKQTKAEIQAVRKESERVKRENSTLKFSQADIDKKINEAVLQKQVELENEFGQRTADLERLLDEKLQVLTTIAAQPQSLPIGDGETTLSPAYSQNIVWVKPADTLYTNQAGELVNGDDKSAIPGFPNLFKALDQSPLGKASTDLHGKPNTYKEEQPPTPFFTIAPNSTLVGSIAMTALIGRVPVNGSLTDPFPFKVIIGQENLMANGIELPDVQGAILSGTASGDWTLSCVNGAINNITFIFQDGRIQSVPDKKESQDNKSIGWLSSPEGIPCIPGERKTNAPQYLTSQFFLSAAEAAAQGLAQGQTTTVVDGNSVIGAVTGDQGKFILGQALGGGLKETSAWVKQRYGQMFDAIYVPPGQEVAVHIDTELRIDYNPNARKVKYNQINPQKTMD